MLLLFSCFFFFIICLFYFILFYFNFFRDSNIISISTVEFRYYIIIILVNLGKPLTIRELGSWDFNEPLSLKQVCGFQTWILIARFLPFVFYVTISEECIDCLGVYSQPSLLYRLLQLHSYQTCPQEYFTNIQYNPQEGLFRILVLLGVI